MNIDTSAEAVEAVRADLLAQAETHRSDYVLTQALHRAEAAIGALAAERDRWQLQHDAAQSVADSRGATVARLERELAEVVSDRDRLAAENTRLREELREVLSWAVIEKAPLREQEIASIRAALAGADDAK